jgi:hypothetical protein
VWKRFAHPLILIPWGDGQVRALFQRLVVALGRALLPYLAPVVARLVRDGRPQDLIDVAPVLGQLAYRFKVRVVVSGLWGR